MLTTCTCRQSKLTLAVAAVKTRRRSEFPQSGRSKLFRWIDSKPPIRCGLLQHLRRGTNRPDAAAARFLPYKPITLAVASSTFRRCSISSRKQPFPTGKIPKIVSKARICPNFGKVFHRSDAVGNFGRGAVNFGLHRSRRRPTRLGGNLPQMFRSGDFAKIRGSWKRIFSTQSARSGHCGRKFLL